MTTEKERSIIKERYAGLKGIAYGIYVCSGKSYLIINRSSDLFTILDTAEENECYIGPYMNCVHWLTQKGLKFRPKTEKELSE